MRKRRQYSKTGFYHVVVRGINKQSIFFDDTDKIFFINLMKKYSKKYEIRVHAYCLMENHVHLELEDPYLNISIFMQCVCSVYARFFNRKYDRIGHLFQERYSSEVINDQRYFLTVFRYILKNPEKSKICIFNQYRWSSYTKYFLKDSFICREIVNELFGNIKDLNEFLMIHEDSNCLEIEMRPSEKEFNCIEKIKRLLKSDIPIIKPELPRSVIETKIKLLKKNGISINTIVRITGISKHIVQGA